MIYLFFLVLLILAIVFFIMGLKYLGEATSTKRNKNRKVIEKKCKELISPESQWLQGIKDADATCVCKTYSSSIYCNLKDKEAPLVIFAKMNEDTDAYSRHEFEKSLNEILRDPKCVHYIVQELRDEDADEHYIKSIYEWEFNGQSPELFPLNVDIILSSDYPRIMYFYEWSEE